MYLWCFIFFFKQKTAYEMRISDWSSDVCSSDLPLVEVAQDRESGRAIVVEPGQRDLCVEPRNGAGRRAARRTDQRFGSGRVAGESVGRRHQRLGRPGDRGVERGIWRDRCGRRRYGLVEAQLLVGARQQDRKSVGEGKSVSVRVDHGGRHLLKTTKTSNKQHQHKTNQ